MLAAAASMERDLRPNIKDKISGRHLLVDTGAAVSVWPQADYPSAPRDITRGLQAVNKSTITSFGETGRELRFDRKIYKTKFIIANIKEPLLGWNFLLEHKLDLIWSNSQCILFNAKRRSSYPLQLGSSDVNQTGLAQITFQQYSHQQKTPTKPPAIQPCYEAIIDRNKEGLHCKFEDRPKHGVVHTIETDNQPTCRAKVPRLLPGSPKEVKGKERWMEMDRLGIIQRIGANEPTTWSSALHLAPKDGSDVRVCGDFHPLNNLRPLPPT